MRHQLSEDDVALLTPYVAAIERFQKQREKYQAAAIECEQMEKLLQGSLSVHLTHRFCLEGDAWHLNLAERELVCRNDQH